MHLSEQTNQLPQMGRYICMGGISKSRQIFIKSGTDSSRSKINFIQFLDDRLKNASFVTHKPQIGRNTYGSYI